MHLTTASLTRISILSLYPLVAGLAACVSVTVPQKPTGAARDPVAWGMLSEAKGCVIFREYAKAKIGFFVVAVTSETHGELEVVETRAYEMEPKVWMQTPESMDELQRLATREGLRYVKIQDKFSPSELEAARVLCGKPNIAR